MNIKIIQHSEKIWSLKSILSPERCDELIRLSEGIGYSEAPVTTASGPVMRKDVRNNERVMTDDLGITDELWQLVKPYVAPVSRLRPVVGLNERLRFYRYYPGQMFDWHYDGFYARPNREKSFYTLMFYLNDSFVGGTTAFETLEVVPQKGDALIFWHYQLHAGLPVESGCKYVLRSDTMYGKVKC